MNIIVKLFRRAFFCSLGKHQRSWSKARHIGPETISECRYCGTPMRKDYDFGWIAADVDLPPE